MITGGIVAFSTQIQSLSGLMKIFDYLKGTAVFFFKMSLQYKQKTIPYDDKRGFHALKDTAV